MDAHLANSASALRLWGRHWLSASWTTRTCLRTAALSAPARQTLPSQEAAANTGAWKATSTVTATSQLIAPPSATCGIVGPPTSAGSSSRTARADAFVGQRPTPTTRPIRDRDPQDPLKGSEPSAASTSASARAPQAAEHAHRGDRAPGGSSSVPANGAGGGAGRPDGRVGGRRARKGDAGASADAGATSRRPRPSMPPPPPPPPPPSPPDHSASGYMLVSSQEELDVMLDQLVVAGYTVSSSGSGNGGANGEGGGNGAASGGGASGRLAGSGGASRAAGARGGSSGAGTGCGGVGIGGSVRALALDCEGVELGRPGGNLCLLQLAARCSTNTTNAAGGGGGGGGGGSAGRSGLSIWLVDVEALGPRAFLCRSRQDGSTSLKGLLEDPGLTKYLFDVRNDAAALASQFGVRLRGVADLQLADVALRQAVDGLRAGGWLEGLVQALWRRLAVEAAAGGSGGTAGTGLGGRGQLKGQLREQLTAATELAKKYHAGNKTQVWAARPLTPELCDYAATDVRYLHLLADAVGPRLNREVTDKVLQESHRRTVLRESNANSDSRAAAPVMVVRKKAPAPGAAPAAAAAAAPGAPSARGWPWIAGDDPGRSDRAVSAAAHSMGLMEGLTAALLVRYDRGTAPVALAQPPSAAAGQVPDPDVVPGSEALPALAPDVTELNVTASHDAAAEPLAAEPQAQAAADTAADGALNLTDRARDVEAQLSGGTAVGTELEAQAAAAAAASEPAEAPTLTAEVSMGPSGAAGQQEETESAEVVAAGEVSGPGSAAEAPQLQDDVSDVAAASSEAQAGASSEADVQAAAMEDGATATGCQGPADQPRSAEAMAAAAATLLRSLSSPSPSPSHMPKSAAAVRLLPPARPNARQLAAPAPPPPPQPNALPLAALAPTPPPPPIAFPSAVPAPPPTPPPIAFPLAAPAPTAPSKSLLLSRAAFPGGDQHVFVPTIQTLDLAVQAIASSRDSSRPTGLDEVDLISRKQVQRRDSWERHNPQALVTTVASPSEAQTGPRTPPSAVASGPDLAAGDAEESAGPALAAQSGEEAAGAGADPGQAQDEEERVKARLAVVWLLTSRRALQERWAGPNTSADPGLRWLLTP